MLIELAEFILVKFLDLVLDLGQITLINWYISLIIGNKMS